MTLGLKLRNVKKFGGKVMGAVRTVGRGLKTGIKFIEPFAPMIAGAIGGPEAAVGVSQLLSQVKKGAEAASKIKGGSVLKNVGEFTKQQLPALKDKANIIIGDTVQQLTKKSDNIQLE
jgi:hypothetical protein